jgi:ABC-type amino acid transport substrate-binding protein
LILPFEIIYLHQIRGFATATAGLVLAAILGTATLVTPPTGALLDHFRPKPILIAGNLTSTLGYAGFAFVDWPCLVRLVSGSGTHRDRAMVLAGLLAGFVVELLARTGMRAGELADLEADAVVRIGTGHWLRIPWASSATTATCHCTPSWSSSWPP